jgi:hypothetical protein
MHAFILFVTCMVRSLYRFAKTNSYKTSGLASEDIGIDNVELPLK